MLHVVKHLDGPQWVTLHVRSIVSLLLVEVVLTNNLTELRCDIELFIVSLAWSRPIRIIYPWNIGIHFFTNWVSPFSQLLRTVLSSSFTSCDQYTSWNKSRVYRGSIVPDSSHSNKFHLLISCLLTFTMLKLKSVTPSQSIKDGSFESWV